MTEQQMPAKFRITWKDGRYVVGIPNYEGGEVVRADIADRMAAALEGLVKAINYRDACSVSRTSALRIADASMRLQSEIEETQAALSAFRSATQDTEARHD